MGFLPLHFRAEMPAGAMLELLRGLGAIMCQILNVRLVHATYVASNLLQEVLDNDFRFGATP
jgi:hypothetical protein